MNYLSIDTEYSSFYSPYRHKSGDLLQIAIRPVVNGVMEEPFNSYVKPLGNVWNKHAERVHGITRKQAESFPHPVEVSQELRKFLQKYDNAFKALGHNPTGDKQYIDRFVKDYDLINEWHKRVNPKWKCTAQIAAKKKSLIPVKNCKLETLAKFFRIPIKAHDALSDADATWKIYDAMSALISASEVGQSQLSELSELEKKKKYIDMKYVMFNGEGSIFISEYATSNREALRIVLEEIWNSYGEV